MLAQYRTKGAQILLLLLNKGDKMTLIEEMLQNTKTIAVIGAKKDEWEYAYKVPF